MVYEKKAQSALEEFLNAIYYEEGRLALINKLGPALSDEEKMEATKLITAQRGNLDRLLEMFKKELEPLMTDICKNGEAMVPYVSKLLSSGNVQVVNNEQPTFVASESVADEAVMVSADTASSETTFVADVPAEEPVMVTGGVTEATGDAGVTVTETVAAAPTDAPVDVQSEASATVTDGATMEAPATDIVATNGDVASTENAGGEVSATEVSSGEVATEGVSATASVEASVSGDLEAAPAEEAAPFVLSPMDEGVAPVPTKEEVKAAEEGVAAADQQLQAIEGMKNDIISDTNMTDTEKTVSLGKYTRMTADTVRAILVTKAQYEKLLSSRDTQKGLLKPEGGLTEATGDAVASGDVTTTEEVKEEAVVAIPDATATDTTAVADGTASEASVNEATANTGSDSVIPAIVGGESAPAAEVTATDNGGGFLPTIESGAETNAPANDAPVDGALVLPMINSDSAPAEQPAAEQASGELVIPGAEVATKETTATDPQAGNNELQAMIEQANALYKAGNTAEAQALFEKIGTMNKEATGDSASAEVADAAKMLVKQ